jgi:hypothetical protein
MKTSLKSILAAGALFGCLLSARPAEAALEARFIGVTPSVLNPGKFTFNYELTIGPDTSVRDGDFLVIYDFEGYVPLSVFAGDPDWTATTSAVGPVAPGTTPSQDTATTNLLFTYKPNPSNTVLIGVIDPVGGPGTLFGADSDFGSAVARDLIIGSQAENENNTGSANAIKVGFVPQGRVVPEASSVMLLLPGLLPVGLMLRKRAAKN